MRKAPSPPDETALIQACPNACSGLPNFLAEQIESLISESPSDYVGLFEDEQLESAVRAFIPRGLPLEDFTPSQVVEAFTWLFAQVIDSKHTYTLGHSIRGRAPRIRNGLGSRGRRDPAATPSLRVYCTM